MKTIETVYNKLNTEKTELATHKVELSLVDDIKKIRASFMKNMAESNKGFNKVRDAAMDLNSITSKIEKNTKFWCKKVAYVKREIKRSAFQRSFRLGDNLDESKIKGNYDNGILTLTIPKVVPTEEERTVRKIKIS